MVVHFASKTQGVKIPNHPYPNPNHQGQPDLDLPVATMIQLHNCRIVYRLV